MKILCVIDSLGSGGAQRQLVNLAIGFKQKGHDVSFLVYHPNDFYKKELEKADISITYILQSNYLKRFIKMRRYIRKGEFDAVLSFLEAANFISTVSGFPYRKWKLVVGERSANPNILKSFKLQFYRWFHLFTDYVVANSQANLDIVKKVNPLLSSNKCRVIYNMIDLENRDHLRCSLPTKENKESFNLIVGASHSKLKNLNGLVEAVNLLPEDKKKSIKINWYGKQEVDGSLSSAKNKIEKYQLNKNFTFHVAIHNLYDKIEEADAAGLFSYYEGFPNFICEGMLLGKPIICTRVSDLPLLLEDNKNAFFCDASDPSTISNALIKLMDMSDDKHEAMVKSNIEIAEKYFNKKVIVDSYLKLLEESI